MNIYDENEDWVKGDIKENREDKELDEEKFDEVNEYEMKQEIPEEVPPKAQGYDFDDEQEMAQDNEV